uniref:Uncharacterized protein n=1 Tax=Octopus bimaculoides TaxID=37653 RepID=A0A0L8I8F4_OCTBM
MLILVNLFSCTFIIIGKRCDRCFIHVDAGNLLGYSVVQVEDAHLWVFCSCFYIWFYFFEICNTLYVISLLKYVIPCVVESFLFLLSF